MAFLYADTAGTLVQIRRDAFDNGPMGAPPAVANILEFDEATNPTLASAVIGDWNNHKLAAGVLTHNGVTVVVTAPGPAAQDATAARALKSALAAGTPLSASDIQAALRFILRVILARYPGA